MTVTSCQQTAKETPRRRRGRAHIVGYGDVVVVVGTGIGQTGRRVAYDLLEGGLQI